MIRALEIHLEQKIEGRIFIVSQIFHLQYSDCRLRKVGTSTRKVQSRWSRKWTVVESEGNANLDGRDSGKNEWSSKVKVDGLKVNLLSKSEYNILRFSITRFWC